MNLRYIYCAAICLFSIYHKPITCNAFISDTRSAWKKIPSDAIVQVFTQRAELDFLQPYRTPDTYPVRGSGFFINNDGHIVTNAHVVDQAIAIWIQIPSCGKRLVKVDLMSVYPEKDLAVLKIADEECTYLAEVFESIPFLPTGNSDTVRRTDKTLALGYPLGQESLKSSTGIISGREFVMGSKMIQMDTPINPGNSGGPLLDEDGYVIGINSAGIFGAQNVGYAIPINDLKKALPHMYENQLVRKPFLGVLTHKVDDNVARYLGNPLPGGCYIAEIAHGSPLEDAGVQIGDMVYKLNGYDVDVYGEMSVPWSEDKVSITDYVSQLGIGENVNLVIYRNGKQMNMVVCAEFVEISPIKRIFPWYETPEYEVFAGMVVMPLTMNHVQLLGDNVIGLRRYTIFNEHTEPVLLVTHIFPNSQLACTRTLLEGYTLHEVNGLEVRTLDDFRKAVRKSIETNTLCIKARDEINSSTDNLLMVLPFDSVLAETIQLSQMYHYPISPFVQELSQG